MADYTFHSGRTRHALTPLVPVRLHRHLLHLGRRALAADQPWVNISDPLIAKLTAGGKKPVWPGETAGIAVDRATGNLFLVVPGDGLFKSTDRGATFARCDGGKVTGRCETAFALNCDPASSRMACFMLDGKCGMSLDGGQTWQAFKDVGRNWDCADQVPHLNAPPSHETEPRKGSPAAPSFP